MNTTLLLRVLFSLLLGGAGIYLFVLAAMLWRRRTEWTRDGVLAEGEVVAMKERKTTNAKNRGSTFAPVVAFCGADGKQRRFTSSQSERPARYRVGDKVMVRCLRDDADIDGVTQSWGPLLAVLLLATLCVTVSVLPYVLNRNSP